MERVIQNYYGSLCTQMYEILHEEAEQGELQFYLSYAQKGISILEPLCGSGRFLIPFLQRGLTICGMDASAEMLAQLKGKRADAKVVCADILQYSFLGQYDYIFISSGSMSLFTDLHQCKDILKKMYSLLKENGVFVFAVDTIANRCIDDKEYRVTVSVQTKEGHTLLLKQKNTYDEKTHTQYAPSIYELYDGENILQSEYMDFQTHLYELGEMEKYLQEVGFRDVKVYDSYVKTSAKDNQSEMFLYECRIEKKMYHLM